MEAALLTMIAAMFVAVLGSIYEQRREGAKIRDQVNDKLDENTEALRELASRTTVLEASHQHLLQDFAEHRRMTEKNFAEVNGGLADARERLARIEGHLGIGIPPPNAAES
ncbi:MAG: hypothetical protein F4X38_03070 [Acidimicrobiaceae bacterium]|nr:hypothetical protein [Acidimicrobiaceae bacterium]